ncbi:hypothetical protein MMC10_008852 [Thelotrema lepadinum]|nr:hypothetical protein [Thelotrema lepadinum]
MDSRAAIPPGLPKARPVTSYWQDPPADIASYQSSNALPTSASTVIIGSGITGSSLAYFLLSQSPSSDVVLLEARTACSSATGRNGGHTKCASYRSFTYNVETLGVDDAVRIVKLEYDTMRAVHAFARERNIDCDSWQGDTLDVIYDSDEWELAKQSIASLQAALGPTHPAARYTFHTAAETATKFLTPNAIGAISYEAGSLSAYKLVIGILKLTLSMGLKLHTSTPAISLSCTPNSDAWLVTTPRGTITAQRVVLATNGYTAHLYPPLQGLIVPLRGHVSAQRPGRGLPSAGLGHTMSFIYRGEYEYLVVRPPGTTHEGDIVIGGASTKRTRDGGEEEFGCTDDTVVDPDISTFLEECTPEYFGPNWGEDSPQGRVRRVWSGIMGFSADGYPFVGELEKGLFVAASFQGHGMVLCFGCAKMVGAMMGGEVKRELDEWLPQAFRFRRERLEGKFEGRMHSVRPKEVEERGVAA